jgi:hypothetical protein
VVRIIAAPLVAEQPVRAHRVLVRPDAAVDRVNRSDRQCRVQLARFPDTSLRVHETEGPTVDLEVTEVLP